MFKDQKDDINKYYDALQK